MSITLKAIWQSSTSLLQRFDLMPPLWVAWVKAIEERHEFTDAIYKLDERPRHIHLRHDAAKELADCIVTLLNAWYAGGYAFDSSPTLSIGQLWADMPTPALNRDAWIDLDKEYYCYFSEIVIASNRALIPHMHYGTCIKRLLSVGRLHRLTLDDIEIGIESVIEKNQNKTPKTHMVKDGFIVKRSQETSQEDAS